MQVRPQPHVRDISMPATCLRLPGYHPRLYDGALSYRPFDYRADSLRSNYPNEHPAC